MKIFNNISRYLLAAIFTILGLSGFFQVIFGEASVSKYFLAIFTLQLTSGVLLFLNRYVPLALAILSPIMLNVLLYGVLMNHANLEFGFFVAILWAVVLVSVRSAFSGIFEARVRIQPVRRRIHRVHLAPAEA